MFGASLLLFLLPIFGTTIQSNICTLVPPTFTASTTTTSTSTAVISGKTTPEAALTLRDNHQIAAHLTTDKTGNFSQRVPLYNGRNSFTVTENNSCGSAVSAMSLVITRTAAPIVSSDNVWGLIIAGIFVLLLVGLDWLLRRRRRRESYEST